MYAHDLCPISYLSKEIPRNMVKNEFFIEKRNKKSIGREAMEPVLSVSGHVKYPANIGYIAKRIANKTSPKLTPRMILILKKEINFHLYL